MAQGHCGEEREKEHARVLPSALSLKAGLALLERNHNLMKGLGSRVVIHVPIILSFSIAQSNLVTLTVYDWQGSSDRPKYTV